MSTALTAEAASDLFRREPDRFLDVGAGEVALRSVGHGPDVLFVHGWPVSGATFRTLLPYLADHVTCHVIDLPGAGSSRFTADTPLTVEQHIQSVRRVARPPGARRRRGGRARQRRDDRPPRPGRRSPGAGDGPDQHRAAARPELALQVVPRRSGTCRASGARSAGWWDNRGCDATRSCSATRSPTPTCSTASSTSSSSGRSTTRTSANDAAIRLLRSFDGRYVRELADVHRRIAVPVQLVWGDQDPFFPVAWAREMVDTFPDARLDVIEGAGLFAHEERPAEVAEALLPVLTGSR